MAREIVFAILHSILIWASVRQSIITKIPKPREDSNQNVSNQMAKLNTQSL